VLPRPATPLLSTAPRGGAPCELTPARHRHHQPVARLRRHRQGGFSLLELSIVIFIISILAALAVPAFKQALLESRARAVANDLRVYAGAFQAYAQEKGDWPAGDAVPGAFPSGMGGSLSKTNWERVTPIGGRYTWAPDSLHQGERYHAAIVLSSTADTTISSDKKQLLEIDRTIDDGDLDTGNFRLGYRNFPVFVIEH
jgi:prepilin-type N-terminal cleavage/methylation domain-containing protein